MEKLIQQIEELGYVVVVGRNIDIFEPYTSNVTGEQMNHTIAMSTHTEDDNYTKKFLSDVLESLKCTCTPQEQGCCKACRITS